MTMMIIVMMICFYFFARHVSQFLLYSHTVSHYIDPHCLPVTGTLILIHHVFRSFCGVCSWSVSPESSSCGRLVCTTKRRGCSRWDAGTKRWSPTCCQSMWPNTSWAPRREMRYAQVCAVAEMCWCLRGSEYTKIKQHELEISNSIIKNTQHEYTFAICIMKVLKSPCVAPAPLDSAVHYVSLPSCGQSHNYIFGCQVKNSDGDNIYLEKSEIYNKGKLTSWHLSHAGAVQPVIQWNRCDVRLHPQLLWLLHWRRHQQWRHRVSPDSQRDHLGLWQRESQQCFVYNEQ